MSCLVRISHKKTRMPLLKNWRASSWYAHTSTPSHPHYPSPHTHTPQASLPEAGAKPLGTEGEEDIISELPEVPTKEPTLGKSCQQV